MSGFGGLYLGPHPVAEEGTGAAAREKNDLLVGGGCCFAIQSLFSKRFLLFGGGLPTGGL